MKRKKIQRKREIGGASPKFYEVFARRTSEDPLTHVGSIEAPNDALAEVRAWHIHDEHEWRELCVVPTAAIIAVTERGRNVKIKEV